MPVNDTHIELQLISNPMPDISDQLSPQIIQEVPKANGVDILKLEHYKQCKAHYQTSPQATKLHYFKISLFPSNCISFPYSLQPVTPHQVNQ